MGIASLIFFVCSALVGRPIVETVAVNSVLNSRVLGGIFLLSISSIEALLLGAFGSGFFLLVLLQLTLLLIFTINTMRSAEFTHALASKVIKHFGKFVPGWQVLLSKALLAKALL